MEGLLKNRAGACPAPSLYIRTREGLKNQCRPRFPGPACHELPEAGAIAQFEPNGDQGFGAGCGVIGAGSDPGNDGTDAGAAFFFGADFFFAFFADFFFAARLVFLARFTFFAFLAFFFLDFFFAFRFFFAMTDL
jgi:hypothetical protein